MKRKTISKITAVVSLILCFLLAFNPAVFAVKTEPNAGINKVSIVKKYGILKGETIQLSATISPDDTILNGLKWSSSNPEIISCTEDGVIKGIRSNGYAEITCKAKVGSGKDKIRIYCVEPFESSVKSSMKNIWSFIYSRPQSSYIATVHLNFNLFLDLYKQIMGSLLGAGFLSVSNALSMGTVSVQGKYGNYAYIRFSGYGASDGFVKHTALSKTINGFLYLSDKNIDIWANGIAYEAKKLTSTYNGDVKWTVSDENLVKYTSSTGYIVAYEPGHTVTITAEADGMKEYCYVHLLYRWPQAWTTKANKNTYLYLKDGSEYVEHISLPKGSEITVNGDDGTNSGWAYAEALVGAGVYPGYIKISDVSTKGTISQYNSLGWIWPVNDTEQGAKAKYITSPYGWRDTDPIRHKGIDVTNGISSSSDFANSVDGYEVVSAFAGKVIYVCDDKYKSCGYCVAIRSTEKDPISRKYYVAIYMHLKYIPDVELNENVSSNKKLGYVGSTGNSGGSHLHFEVNNQNLSYGQKIYYESNSEKEMVFGSVINPLFFYMNYYNSPENDSDKIKINPTCDAMNYRKPLWYGDDIKESKKP